MNGLIIYSRFALCHIEYVGNEVVLSYVFKSRSVEKNHLALVLVTQIMQNSEVECESLNILQLYLISL